MHHSTVIWRCTAQRADGSFCDAPSIEDVPFPICGHHAYRIWKRMSRKVQDVEGNPSLLLKLAFDQIDAARAREDELKRSRVNVVYYVLVGDLLKIGTTGRLKARLAQFPPHKKLLATEPGSIAVERQRHQEFADLLASGNEWFRFEGRLVEHVRALRDQVA